MHLQNELAMLNIQQKAAVTHTEGPLLVLAGAGSGKTRVITTRIAYLIHRGIAAESILAVTFTNRAAREMRERALSMLRDGRAGTPVIATFHSFCLSILRAEIELIGYRRDFTIYDASEQLSLMRNILSDITFSGKQYRIEELMERISRTKNATAANTVNGSGPDELETIAGILAPRYHEALKSLNALDFDDLLVLTLRLFREIPSVLDRYRNRFRYLMVDEYQDTNHLQYEFVKLLAGERRNLCVVGDDDQSIYGWRGARLGNILDFDKDFPGTRVVRLEQNYRSSGNILEAANGVIVHNRKRMAKSLWSSRDRGPCVTLFRARNGEDEARWVVETIELLKYEKGVSLDDCAVLYRANMFSRPFEEALRSKRIPYSVVGGMSYFEHREIKDLAAYLKAIANPFDDLSILRIANIPRRGLGPTALGRIADFSRAREIRLIDAFKSAGEIPGLSPAAVNGAQRLHAMIEDYRSRFARTNELGAAFRSLVDEIAYAEYIRGLYRSPEAGLRRLENLGAFIASLDQYERSAPAPTLHGFLETLALTDLLKDKEEKRASGVTLISLHSSKGLEFPYVFITAAEEDILPHRKSSEDIEEERRLFYVGITRARHELFLTFSESRTRYGKESPSTRSRFIDEIPESILRYASRNCNDNEGDEAAADRFFANIQDMLGE